MGGARRVKAHRKAPRDAVAPPLRHAHRCPGAGGARFFEWYRGLRGVPSRVGAAESTDARPANAGPETGFRRIRDFP